MFNSLIEVPPYPFEGPSMLFRGICFPPSSCLLPRRAVALILATASLTATSLLSTPSQALGQESYDKQKPIIVAHRGGAGEFEENTLAACKASYDQGIRGFEIDIRLTKDGELVVVHDDSLDRTHTGKGPVEHLTRAELESVKTKKIGEPLLYLSDLLDYFADKPGIYLELEMKTSNKALYPDERIAEYCQKLHAMGTAKQPEGSLYLFTSFDKRPLREIRKIDAKATTLYINGKACSQEFVDEAKELGATYIGCSLDKTSRFAVREAQKAGIKVSGWPGKSLEDYQLAILLGMDVHCTDFPMAVLDLKASK